MTSCKPPPTCIDASPIPDANDSRMSAIPYEANLTPMGAARRPPLWCARRTSVMSDEKDSAYELGKRDLARLRQLQETSPASTTVVVLGERFGRRPDGRGAITTR